MVQVDPSTVLGSGEIAVNIVRFLITFVAGVFVTRVAVMPLVERAVSRKTDTRTHHSLVNFAGITGLFVSFTVALQAGSFGNLATIIGAIAAALTVAVGFGMRDQISNLVAGILLYFDPPFINGDYIEVNGQSGVVKQTNLRDTVLRDERSQKKVIPNSMITGNPTINYSRLDKSRGRLSVDVNADKVSETEDLLEKIAEENPDILKKPAPETRIDIEGPKAVLHYWVDNPKKTEKIRSDLSRQYLQEASEKGLIGQKEE